MRLIRNIAEKNPRFKNTLGSVTFPANTTIAWKDVWVSIRNVAASGTRLSFDYYLCTQQGRAVLAKVADKPGQLIEWVREVDKTRQTPVAGVYYLNVDFFDERTNYIGLTGQQFKWTEGKVTNASGSIVYFRPGIDVTMIAMTDQSTGLPVKFNGFNQTSGAFAYLLTPVNSLACMYTSGLASPAWNSFTLYSEDTVVTYGGEAWIAADSSTNINQIPSPDSSYWSLYNAFNPSAGQNLVPNTDFWYERPQTTTICLTTLGGSELVSVPPNISFTVTDQDGYVLRPNIDYTMYGSNFIQLATYSPAGSTLYCNAVVKVDPTTTPGTNPENILQVGLLPNETLAPGQVYIHTTAGDFPNVSANSDGTITIPQLLEPGQWCYWEARIEVPQVKLRGKKWELNSFVIVDPSTIKFQQLPAPQGQPEPAPIQTNVGEPLLLNAQGEPAPAPEGQPQFFLPGLHVAIGDQVIVGDQTAIVVSPAVTETYEVYGSKENLNFTLEVKSNDLQTSSDLAEMLKQQLLIWGRENEENDGLTIFEATRDFVGTARDASATAPSYIYTVSVTASADWKVFVPLITRLVRYEIIGTITNPDFQGKLQMASRMRALGNTSFIPSY